MTSQPDMEAATPAPAPPPVLTVRDLRTQVATPAGPKIVVDGLDLDLAAGEVLCIAGESGSGKSMAALSIMGLLPKPMARVAGGSVRLDGRELLGLGETSMRAVRGAEIAMIFQEPMTSLNPVLTIGRDQIGETIEAAPAPFECARDLTRKQTIDMLLRGRAYLRGLPRA